MCSLARFPDILDESGVTVCQIDGNVQYANPEFLNLRTYTDAVTDHPTINLPRDGLVHPKIASTAGTLLLPEESSLLERIEDAWFEAGIGRILELLDEESTVLKYPARYLRLLMKSVQLAIKYTVAPRYEEYNSLAHTERERSPVVCISWHPHSLMIAVAIRDDTVVIYSRNSNFTPFLKSKAQRRITAISWRPGSLSELAVACSAGVYLWDIDRQNLTSRPAISTNARLLRGCYVTSVSWSPEGDYLVMANNSNYMTVWCPDEMRKVDLKNSGGGISQVSWSPDGSKIIACSNSHVVRIWNTSNWMSDLWKTSGGQATFPVWSADGSVVLFATRNDPCLCRFNFSTDPQNSGVQAVADLAFTKFGDDYQVGGDVTGMTWDPSNQYLAIIFANSPLVAVFYTKTSPMFSGLTFSIKPGFFIKGAPNELPTSIAFEINFKQGANLTICWSSGRLQYFPIVSNLSKSRHSSSNLSGYRANSTGMSPF
ncbi:WD domain, G-beta repeat [Nesidiocoris tenuis]|uniref:WD domain, G-beta repeat n=1 Tax=Nesidiocoris tenuis TaxID=355587 RepID=A0ABN7API6_9HEMI|nr:WD domain, G-beta repeat [Nesidiocoris tenuis]